MFIERSVAKIRLVRTLFVLLAVLPCLVLAAWAAYRHSEMHRESLRREAERLLGVRLRIGGVVHVRPGAFRLDECALVSATGATVVLPRLEVERTPDEVRLRVPELRCSPAAAALLAGVGRAWITEPVRFPWSWVVDIGAFSWDVAGGADAAAEPSAGPPRASPLRIECVAAGGARAVRVFRPVAEGGLADEVRVIAEQDDAAREGPRHELHARVRDPVPWPVVRALLEPSAIAALPVGMSAHVSGTVEATAHGSAWSGTASGSLDGVDLAAAGAGGGRRLAGDATIAVERLEWAAGRIVRLDAACAAVRGRIAQTLLDALVSTCGCRPGPAYRSLSGEEMRPFDDLSCTVAVDESGVRLRASPSASGLVRLQGLSLIDEPVMPVPFDRVAWLFAVEGGPAVPASPASAWLMSVFPLRDSGPGGPAAGGNGPQRTGSARPRSDF